MKSRRALLSLVAGALIVGGSACANSDTVPPAATRLAAESNLVDVCKEHRPSSVKGVEPGVVVETTAGELEMRSKLERGESFPPWSTLREDHAVAGCAYGPTDKEVANAPSTVCPDGEEYSLARPRQYFVDGDGRWTKDPFEYPEDHC